MKKTTTTTTTNSPTVDADRDRQDAALRSSPASDATPSSVPFALLTHFPTHDIIRHMAQFSDSVSGNQASQTGDQRKTGGTQGTLRSSQTSSPLTHTFGTTAPNMLDHVITNRTGNVLAGPMAWRAASSTGSSRSASSGGLGSMRSSAQPSQSASPQPAEFGTWLAPPRSVQLDAGVTTSMADLSAADGT